MTKARKNLHRWKSWVDSRQLEILEEAADVLRWAWKLDKRTAHSYPVQTFHELWETKSQLRDRKTNKRTPTKLPAYRRPKCLHDFIDEPVVKLLYEQQHSGSYKDALEQAANGYGAGLKAWKKIVECLAPAYLLSFAGEESLPKPRVNFLHRELLEIAHDLELDRAEGLAEFLDDICPCGNKHNAEAIRKLGKRMSKSHPNDHTDLKHGLSRR